MFAVDVRKYTNSDNIQRDNVQKAQSIWNQAMQVVDAA